MIALSSLLACLFSFISLMVRLFWSQPMEINLRIPVIDSNVSEYRMTSWKVGDELLSPLEVAKLEGETVDEILDAITTGRLSPVIGFKTLERGFLIPKDYKLVNRYSVIPKIN